MLEGDVVELYLIRHGQARYFGDDGKMQNSQGFLTELGHRQAERVGERCRNLEVDYLYSSPLKRVQETVSYLSRALGKSPEFLEWLREISVGDFDGWAEPMVRKHLEEVALRPLAAWWDGYPRGETFREFHKRVTRGLDYLLKSHSVEKDGDSYRIVGEQDQRLCLVCHAGTISVIVSYLLELQPVPWEWHRFSSENTGVSCIQFGRVGDALKPSLIFFNSISHLNGI